MKRQRTLQLGIAYGIVAFAVVVFTFPIIWLTLSSFKPPVDVLSVSLPTRPTLQNYRDVLETYPIGRYLRNSLIVAAGSTSLSLVAGSLAAYSFARNRYRFLGRGPLLLFILLLRMLPGISIGIPLYLLFSNIGLTDKLSGLILAHAAIQLPLVIWIMQGFFQEVPVELEESGMVDGNTRLSVLVQIVLPLVTPGLAVTAILSFLVSWNDFGLALILAPTPMSQTMPVALSQMTAVYGIRWDVMSAAATMYIVPTIVLALLLQRYIVQGLTAGAVKG